MARESNKEEQSFSREEQMFLKAMGIVFARLRKVDADYDSQEDFANYIGMSRSQYQVYEAGTNMKIISMLRLLSHHEMEIQDYIPLVVEEYKRLLSKTSMRKIKSA